MAQTNATLVCLNTDNVYLFTPRSITASIGGNLQWYSKNVYLVHDVYAKVGQYYPRFVEANPLFESPAPVDRYVHTIMFLDNMLEHYSRHNVLPKNLIHDLVQGYCLPPDAADQWRRYLAEVQQIPFGPGAYREYIQVGRLQHIGQFSALCYADHNDRFDQLHCVLYTIQQLLVEYGLFLAGPMTLPDVKAA